MARPLRIEFPGAVYHVSSRRTEGLSAFADDDDRRMLLELLAQAAHRFDGQVLAYCLLPDHYDVVLYTRQANLSRLMRHVNGVYTQYHNRRHGGSGALFQGRFKAVLVDRDALLLDVCRDVEQSPKRLGLVVGGSDVFPWSSHRAHAGLIPAPDWLDVNGLHSYVLGRAATTPADHRKAAERYAKLMAADPNLDLWKHLRHQIFLGDDAFVERMQALAGRVPRRTAKPRAFGEWLRDSGSREQALYRAHTEGGLSMTTLADTLGLSVSRVSRLIAGFEQAHTAH